LITTRGMSTLQPWCSQESTRKTLSRWSSRGPEDAFGSTWKPAILDYEKIEGLSDPDIRDYTHGLHLTK
jgi:hypothetical protein